MRRFFCPLLIKHSMHLTWIHPPCRELAFIVVWLVYVARARRRIWVPDTTMTQRRLSRSTSWSSNVRNEQWRLILVRRLQGTFCGNTYSVGFLRRKSSLFTSLIPHFQKGFSRPRRCIVGFSVESHRGSKRAIYWQMVWSRMMIPGYKQPISSACFMIYSDG